MRLLPLLFAALPLSACGGATAKGAPPAADAGTDGLETDAPSGDAGTDASTTDAPSGDTGTDAPATDAPSGDAGEDGPSLETTGTMLLLAYGGESGEVAAELEELEPGVGQEETCAAPVDAGACQFLSCQLGGIGDPTPGYGDFGPLSVTVGTTTVPLTYDFEGYGTVYFPSSVTLGTGGAMTFHGGGGGVPTFDVSATIPGLPVLTSPVAGTTDGGGAVIDTSQDLTVTWVPISIGQIHFELNGGAISGQGSSDTAVTVTCTFDGSAGSGVVAQSLLSSLKAGAGTSPTYAVLTSELDTTTVVGGLTIETQSFQESPATEHGFDVTLE